MDKKPPIVQKTDDKVFARVIAFIYLADGLHLFDNGSLF